MTQKSRFSRTRYLSLPTAAFLPILMVCVAVLFSGPRLNGQVQDGINGTVTDPSGAVVAGARVTATNSETGVVASAVTSSVGSFTIVGLIPGSYSVEVEAAGFKTVKTDLTVEVAKMSTTTFQMSPGARTETVEVKAADILLNTTSPGIGTTLEPELVKNAPIEITGLARQIDSFMYLLPGVQGVANAHNINGGVTYENETQFNGVPVVFVQFAGNQTYINPPYESINVLHFAKLTCEMEHANGDYRLRQGEHAGSAPTGQLEALKAAGAARSIGRRSAAPGPIGRSWRS